MEENDPSVSSAADSAATSRQTIVSPEHASTFVETPTIVTEGILEERPRVLSSRVIDYKLPQYRVRVTTPRFSDSKIGVPGVDSAISGALLSDTEFTILVSIDASSINDGLASSLESPPRSPRCIEEDEKKMKPQKEDNSAKFDRGEGREEGRLEWFVIRNFNDFSWLHQTLGDIFQEAIIPALPKNTYTSAFAHGYLEVVRRGVEFLLEWVTRHPWFRQTHPLAVFLEAKSWVLAHEIEKSKLRSKLTAATKIRKSEEASSSMISSVQAAFSSLSASVASPLGKLRDKIMGSSEAPVDDHSSFFDAELAAAIQLQKIAEEIEDHAIQGAEQLRLLGASFEKLNESIESLSVKRINRRAVRDAAMALSKGYHKSSINYKSLAFEHQMSVSVSAAITAGLAVAAERCIKFRTSIALERVSVLNELHEAEEALNSLLTKAGLPTEEMTIALNCNSCKAHVNARGDPLGYTGNTAFLSDQAYNYLRRTATVLNEGTSSWISNLNSSIKNSSISDKIQAQRDVVSNCRAAFAAADKELSRVTTVTTSELGRMHSECDNLFARMAGTVAKKEVEVSKQEVETWNTVDVLSAKAIACAPSENIGRMDFDFEVKTESISENSKCLPTASPAGILGNMTSTEMKS